MSLTVSATPNSQWELLVPLLEQLGWNQHNTVKIADMAANKGEPASGPYLLLHSRPELAVALAMEEGKDPDAALSEWRTAAEQLLAFYKRHNRQAAVAEVNSVCERPRALVEWLTNNHPAFKDSAPANPEVELASVGIEPSSLNLLLATQWVSQQQALSPLLAQLEAASIPLADSGYQPPTIDVATLYQNLSEQTEAKQTVEQQEKTIKKLTDEQKDAEAQQKDLQEENDLILKQLFKVQEELEKYYLDNQSLKKKRESLQAELKKSKNQFKEKTRHLEKTINELSSQLEQLHQQNSLSYKLKAPLRLLRGLAHRLSPKRWRLAKQIKLVRQSDYFDADWYLNKYPDLKGKRVDPAKHYVLFGGTEGRDPSPKFCSNSYLKNNPDVAEIGFNPLVHYLLHGKPEGRKV